MDEKEYIERRTAINIVLNHAGNWATAFCELKNVPSADVQEVVRCKDCKNRKSSEFCECREPDAYCSDGERMDGE